MLRIETADTTDTTDDDAEQTGPAGDVLTLKELATFLKLSDQHTRRLAEAGELPGRKLGDRWRFSRGAVLRHLDYFPDSGEPQV